MAELYVGHFLLVLVLVFFPKQPRRLLLGWQHVLLLGVLWWDLLSRLYGLMRNQLYFWELCAFYERVYEVEGMFWLLFAYHHVAALVGLLLMVEYLRHDRFFAVFWTFLAAYPLLLNWLQSERQVDVEGQFFYELPELSTINRDITSLIVEFNGGLALGYFVGLCLLLAFFFFLSKKRNAVLASRKLD
jgi:hypothetical protein